MTQQTSQTSKSERSLQPLVDFFLTLAPFTKEEVAPLLGIAQIVDFRAGDSFLKIGDDSDRFGFVFKGAFRGYYVNDEGKEFTRDFYTEGKFVGSYNTMLTNSPCMMNVVALEDSTVAEMSFQKIRSFFDVLPRWERAARIMAELFYVAREQRTFQLLVHSAQDRYVAFQKEYPNLEKRVTQAQIASFLGIAPESLSRIRRTMSSKS